MKVERKVRIEIDRLQIGDRIKVKFSGEKHKATAIRREDDGMLFLLDDCLDRAMPINENGGTEGGYDASDLREYLVKKASEISKKLQDRMVAFENGDYFRLLTLQEVCGIDTEFNKTDGQIEWMKDRRHRMTARKGNEYVYWWLRGVVSATAFAGVTSYGNAYYGNASYSNGVRPAFKIRDL